jgi:hypothetical protein
MISHNARNLWMLNPAWNNDDHPGDPLQKLCQGWRVRLE